MEQEHEPKSIKTILDDFMELNLHATKAERRKRALLEQKRRRLIREEQMRTDEELSSDPHGNRKY